MKIPYAVPYDAAAGYASISDETLSAKKQSRCRQSQYLRQVLSSHPERYMRRYLRQFVPGLEFSTATR